MPVTITMPVPTGIDESRLVILHFDDDGSFETVIPRKNGDGTVTFTVTHFSTFVFAESTTASGAADTNQEGKAGTDTNRTSGTDNNSTRNTSVQTVALGTSPKTGDHTNIYVPIELMAAGLILVDIATYVY